jgi:radical SAM/Cys-rich protein
MLSFARRLQDLGYAELRAEAVDILQVNLGWRCNQTCKHCHLEAGPHRTEVMDRKTAEAVAEAVERWGLPVVDLTGGAPELNPHFEYLVARLTRFGAHVINRCNLTVLLEPDKGHLPAFFQAHRVELVCSLPSYEEQQVDRLRGPGVFDKSLEALRRLNDQGYGREGSGLLLHLMANPAGAYLPARQAELEARFHQELKRRYGLSFNRLYTLLNMPIGRFLEFLRRSNNYGRYLDRLATSFNPATVPGLMCRHLISVAWDGRLFDCDFNQALNLNLVEEAPQTILEFDLPALQRRRIRLDDHCYGCTAGGGSSCGGCLDGGN